MLAVGAGWGCLDIFSFVYHFSFLSSLWETARYRLKYCLKGRISPKQPTGQHPFEESALNPIALRRVKTPQSFGRSECNRVKEMNFLLEERSYSFKS